MRSSAVVGWGGCAVACLLAGAVLAPWAATAYPLAVALLPLLGVAIVAWLVERRWFAPGPFFAAYWLLAAALPVLLLPGALVSDDALISIGVGVAVFSLSAAAATARSDRTIGLSGPQAVPVLARPTTLRRFVNAGTAAGVLAGALVLRNQGLNFGAITSLGGLLDTGNALAVARYAGQSNRGPFVPVLLGIAYAASLAAPFTRLDPTPHRRPRLLVLAPFLSVLLYSTLTTERLGLLLSAAFTASGYVAMRLLRDGEVPTLSPRIVLGGGIAAAVVGGLFAAIAFVRVGRVDVGIVPIILNKLSVYAFGYLPGFSQWLAGYRLHPEPLGWGTGSLAGMEFLTGQERDATRGYLDRMVIDLDGATTNVFTGFRNIVLDFGEPGALAILAVAGFLLGRAYRAVKLRRSPTSAVALGCGYAAILLSNTMLVTTFTNVVVAMLLAVVVVSWTFKAQPGMAGLAPQRESSRSFGVLRSG